MNNRKLHIVFQFLIVFLFVSFRTPITNTIIHVETIQTVQENIAGNPVNLIFSSNDSGIQLFCTSSYATVILDPVVENNQYHFKLPEHIYNKRGLINWKIIKGAEEIISGKINITSSSQKTIMESYAGPPSIIAGGVDYFMFTICPTDQFDNPLPDDTDVLINHQFNSRIVSTVEKIKNLTTWKTIFSYDQSGRFLINSECNKVSSKEFTVEVYPNNAADFSISSKRFHDFADGNQIASFKTSIIKDAYGNVVSDGTHVIFVTRNSEGKLLTTYGNTIDGIAVGKMLHPDKEESWKTHAYIDGIAESDTLNINFRKLFNNFDVRFSNSNREIIIGPIKSFMNQLIPDGFVTQLKIIKNDSLIEIKEMPTRKGFAKFYLDPDFYRNDIYNLDVKTGGITKNFTKELNN